MTYDEMTTATRTAVGARNARRDELAERIRAIIADALDACGIDHVEVAGHAIKRVRWAIDDHLVILRGPERDLARSFGDITSRGLTLNDRDVRPATVAMLRQIATALPEVVARLHADRQARMAEQAAAATEARVAVRS